MQHSAGAQVPAAQMQAELATKIDSKTAKAGDVVEARTTKSMTLGDGTVIPKESKLLGTVTAVQAHDKAQADSTVALSFDRVRLRGGQEVLLKSSIDSLSSPVAVSAGGDLMMDDMAGGPVGARGAVGNRAALGGGGLVGGVAGGAGNAVGRTGNALGSTAQNTGTLARGTTQAVGSTVNAAVHRCHCDAGGHRGGGARDQCTRGDAEWIGDGRDVGGVVGRG